jgi:hypothetical protein
MLNLEKYQVQIAQDVTIHKYMLPHQNYFCSTQKYSKQKEGLAIGAPKSTLILKNIYNNYKIPKYMFY